MRSRLRLSSLNPRSRSTPADDAAISAKASVALLEVKSQSTVGLDSQQAHVAFIKSQLERERKLTERSLQSVSKLQEAEFNYLTAQAMLQQARVNLASAKAELERQKIALRDTDIRSPIDGVIKQIVVSEKQAVDKNQTLILFN